jgi:hypothetical protein
MAGRGKDNSIHSPPTPEQTPGTPRPHRKSTAPGETTLPRSADLRGNQASGSPTPPQVALPRWGSSSGSLIPTRCRHLHPDNVSWNPSNPQLHPPELRRPPLRNSLTAAPLAAAEPPDRRRSTGVERRLLDLAMPTRSAAATAIAPLGLCLATPPATAVGGRDPRGEVQRRPAMAPRCGPVRLHGDGVGRGLTAFC